MTIFFSEQTANGNSESATHTGGPLTVFCDGTFDGATVKLQVRRPGGDWQDDTDLTFTAGGHINLQLVSGVEMRGDISGVGASTSVNLVA